MNIFKTLKLWQIGVLVAILVGAAGGTYGGYVLLAGSNGDGISGGQQLIPVQLGDLVNQVSTSGSIIFPEREILTFGTAGMVEKVLVEEGEQVEQGQVLAELDKATVQSLEQLVVEERIALQSAEDALDQSKDPRSPLDMAEAEAQVANANLALKESLDSLDYVLNPSTLIIAQSEAEVATTEILLNNAQEAVENLLFPSSLAIGLAEQSVADAELDLQEAQQTLDVITEPNSQVLAQAEVNATGAEYAVQEAQEALKSATLGPTDDEIASAQAQEDLARTALAKAEQDLLILDKEWNASLDQSQEELDAAVEEYLLVFEIWLGIDSEELSQDLDPDAQLDSLGVDLNALFDDANQEIYLQSIPPDDPETVWKEPVVYLWLNFFPEDVVAECEGQALSSQTFCVSKEMDAAWDNLVSAQDAFDTAQTDADSELSSAVSDVINAQEDLAAAQDSLNDLLQDSDQLEIAALENDLALVISVLNQAESDLLEIIETPDSLVLRAHQLAVAVAEAELEEGQDQLAILLGPPDPLMVETLQREVDQAQASFEQAQEDLAELIDGGSQEELEAKEKQVGLAIAKLDQAEEELAEMNSSVDPLEVALREHQVMSAQIDLDDALLLLQNASLMAPMDEVISVVNVEPGQDVGPMTTIFEIVDPGVIEVDGIVDEIDVLFVRLGAEAQITMDALPNQVLSGTVSAIASEPDNQQGVVSFPIRIEVQVPPEIGLIEGLSATANIVIREDSNVLLIPSQAIYGTFQQPYVLFLSRGELQEQPVTLGNNDGFWTVVVDGLQQGDQIAMEIAEANEDPFALVRQQVQGGGGFGRGGAGGGGFGGGGGAFGGRN